ncbi:hypothetical protein [Thalassospira xiamenensis]|uniref:Uncharacterized protein n=1 Tax=Thalassospira xiamenensis TaxID=220697 RepID=A0A285TW66_9PROT|nr:hypothetical protein [Thalassospira xiamenensis]SOC26194.1 hypothetical protein SAMN05428964_10577 [Thalassospira xiamenensis]
MTQLTIEAARAAYADQVTSLVLRLVDPTVSSDELYVPLAVALGWLYRYDNDDPFNHSLWMDPHDGLLHQSLPDLLETHSSALGRYQSFADNMLLGKIPNNSGVNDIRFGACLILTRYACENDIPVTSLIQWLASTDHLPSAFKEIVQAVRSIKPTTEEEVFFALHTLAEAGVIERNYRITYEGVVHEVSGADAKHGARTLELITEYGMSFDIRSDNVETVWVRPTNDGVTAQVAFSL